jgi:ABC-2 type transport system permease protein
MLAVVRKELADYFNSVRFFVLFLLVLVSAGLGLYAVHEGIRTALAQAQSVTGNSYVFMALFTASFPGVSFLNFAIIMAIVVPIMGIVLGCDMINIERSGGTMSRLLAQPVYRDGVINGKFLAGLITMSLMIGFAFMLMIGLGLKMIGVPPMVEEIIRLFVYFVITIVYGAFWMALAVLFSVLFRRVASSLMIPIILFIIFFCWMLLVPVIVSNDTSAPLQQQLHTSALQESLSKISPNYLYDEAYYMLLVPQWKGLGAITYSTASYMVVKVLGLGQTLLEIWPNIIGLICLSVVFFAISYIVFMKQEIRAT